MQCHLSTLDMTFRTLIALLLLSIASEINARQFCYQDWACAGVSDINDEATFWIENAKGYPITVTLKVNARNLRNDAGKQNRFEVTRVLKDKRRIGVLQLIPVNRKHATDYHYDIKWAPGDMHAQHDADFQYQLPHQQGKRCRVVQGFNGGYSHRGASKYAVDFAMPEGTPVHTARAGKVIDITAHHWRGGASRRYSKYANYIVVLHDDGTTGEYYHLQQNGVLVQLGQQVKAGQHIGYSGNNGFSSLPHLHFAVYRAKSHCKYESLPFQFEQRPAFARWSNMDE